MESTFLWMGDAFRRASDSYCLFPSFLFLKYTEAIFKSIMAFIFDPSETLVNKEQQTHCLHWHLPHTRHFVPCLINFLFNFLILITS